ARQKIHPFQYLMVGAALCLFYLLLLSISEFIGFSWAYLIAAVASTLLITWYCRFFLGGGVRTFMIGAGLAGVYLFLYITLRQEDYARLMGAIPLFVVLAIANYGPPQKDWYARATNGGAMNTPHPAKTKFRSMKRCAPFASV